MKALQSSSGVCLLPFGIIEKHGPSGPLGTDLINVRGATLQAVKQQYAIVFPEYYFGQIAEARHQPGTVAYRSDLQLELLQATTDEMARNGCRKVLIVNGHGGNTALLQYFIQLQLDSKKDYVVYIYGGMGPRSERIHTRGRGTLKTRCRWACRGRRDRGYYGQRTRLGAPGESGGRIRSRSKAIGTASRTEHGHLVVCELSKSLRRRRSGSNSYPGRGLTRPKSGWDCEGNRLCESRYRGASVAAGVL